MRADAVDVALDEVAAESVGQAHRAFEVDRVADARATPSACARASRRPRRRPTSRRRSSTTVRQQPLTAIESPIAASSSTALAAISSARPLAFGVTARATVPSSSTMPVNIRPATSARRQRLVVEADVVGRSGARRAGASGRRSAMRRGPARRSSERPPSPSSAGADVGDERGRPGRPRANAPAASAPPSTSAWSTPRPPSTVEGCGEVDAADRRAGGDVEHLGAGAQPRRWRRRATCARW